MQVEERKKPPFACHLMASPGGSLTKIPPISITITNALSGTIQLTSGFEGKLERPNAEYVKKHTGFSIGGVSPLTISKKIPILIDESLNRFNLLWASAGHTHWVFASSFKTLIKLTNGQVIKKLSKD